MKQFFALAATAATVAQAAVLGWEHGKNIDELDEIDTVAPVLVLHGLNGNCPQIHDWVTGISSAID